MALDWHAEEIVFEKEPIAEIVRSGVWLYDDVVPTEVWIVKQNFEYGYEEGYSDAPESLNAEGEQYQVIIARKGAMMSVGPSRLSLPEAIEAAEQVVPVKIEWTNQIQKELFGGERYSNQPPG